LTTTVINQINVSTNGGNDGAATVSVIGGSAPYSFIWSTIGVTSDTATNLSAGTYNVQVTDANGGSTTQVVTITQPQMPYQIQLVDLKDVSCNGANDGSISVQVLGGTPPYTYSWSVPVGNTPIISNLQPGVYTLTVTDSDSNVISNTYSILEPAVLTSSIGTVVHNNCSSSTTG